MARIILVLVCDEPQSKMLEPIFLVLPSNDVIVVNNSWVDLQSNINNETRGDIFENRQPKRKHAGTSL